MGYNKNEKISGLTLTNVYKKTLRIPVIDGSDTKAIDAGRLGNAYVEFTTDNVNWSTTYTPSAIALRISTDGGATFKHMQFVNAGTFVVFSDRADWMDDPSKIVSPSTPVFDASTMTVGWQDNSGNWYMNNDSTRDTVWMATTFYNGISWTPWVVTRIKGQDGKDGEPGKDGEDGLPGEPGADAIQSFSVNIFKVSAERPADIDPATGTFEDPVPASLNASGWYDTPQSFGSENVWMATRTYSQAEGGTTPWVIIQVEGLAALYTVWSDSEEKPAVPANKPVTTNYVTSWEPAQGESWKDDTESLEGPAKWMAVIVRNSGIWGIWNITRIFNEGKDGEPGTGLQIDFIIDSYQDLDTLNATTGQTAFNPNTGYLYVKTDSGWSNPFLIGAGSSGLTVLLTNESHTVGADNAGVVDSSELGISGSAQTSVQVFSGAEAYAFTSEALEDKKFSIAINEAVNCTAAISTFTGKVYITSFDPLQDTAHVELTITVKQPTLEPVQITKTFTLSKSKSAANGEGTAKLVSVTATPNVFVYNALGQLKNTNLSYATLSASAFNMVAPLQYTWHYKDSNSSSWVALPSNTAAITVAHNSFSSIRSFMVTVTDDEGSSLNDVITLYKVSDGINGKDGLDGEDGTPGKSAYQIAVENGFQGTEQQWLQSLYGIDGSPGKSLEVEYSATTTGPWSSVFQVGTHIYMRQRIQGGTWSWAIRIVGEPGAPGADGKYTEYIFRRSTIQPLQPTGNSPSGWSDAPPSGTEALWMSRGVKGPNGILQGVWSIPVRVTGDAGKDGDQIVSTDWEFGNLWGVRSDGSRVMIAAANTLHNNFKTVNGEFDPQFSIWNLASVIGVSASSIANKPKGLYIQHGDANNIAYIGFWNGTRFTSYFDYNGNFYFGNQSGLQAMEWDSINGIWQIGNVVTGSGMKWEQNTQQLTVVGKFLTVDNASKTRIEINPGVNNSAPYFRMHHQGGYGVEIVASKVYSGTGAVQGGSVIARAFEAKMGINSSYMIEVGLPKTYTWDFNNQTYTNDVVSRIFRGSYQISEPHDTDLFMYEPERVLTNLDPNQLWFRRYASITGEEGIALKVPNLRINGRQTVNKDVTFPTSGGNVTMKIRHGLITEITGGVQVEQPTDFISDFYAAKVWASIWEKKTDDVWYNTMAPAVFKIEDSTGHTSNGYGVWETFTANNLTYYTYRATAAHTLRIRGGYHIAGSANSSESSPCGIGCQLYFRKFVGTAHTDIIPAIQHSVTGSYGESASYTTSNNDIDLTVTLAVGERIAFRGYIHYQGFQPSAHYIVDLRFNRK